jgi:ribonuclease P protein component
VAIVVPKFGFTGVRRNKLKRQLRELTRQCLLTTVCSCDLLVRARHETYEAPFEKLRDEIYVIARQLQ